MPTQVNVVQGKADFLYLMGLKELYREDLPAERSKEETNANNCAWALKQVDGARYHAQARSMDGGNGAGPSRPASTYRLDISRTASVQPNSPGCMGYDQGSNGKTQDDVAKAVSSP